MESIAEPHTDPRSTPPRFRRWTLLVLAAALVIATASGFGVWWHRRQPEERFARALAALDAKRYAEVRSELEALDAAGGPETQRHFLRGCLRLQAGQYFPALEEFGSAADDPELRVRTLTLSGEALYRVQDFQAAVGLLVQAVNADPQHVDAQRWLAAAYYDLGLTNDAMRHLAQVAELDTMILGRIGSWD